MTIFTDDIILRIVQSELTSDFKNAVLAELVQYGWAFLTRESYGLAHYYDIEELQSAYGELKPDPYAEQRNRAYLRLTYDQRTGKLTEHGNEPYQQTYEANDLDGHVQRRFPPIPERMRNSLAFRHLIARNIAIVLATYEIDDSEISLGIHTVRYLARARKPSFSSPIWLHKDDEPAVVMNVIGESPGLVGGDSIISPDAKKYVERVFHLGSFEGMILSRNTFHMVVPMEPPRGECEGYRDMVLTTFQASKARMRIRRLP